MITLRIDADVRAFERGLDDLAKKQLPFAIRQALSATAKVGQGAVRTAMPSVFDRPTPFTLGGVLIVPGRDRQSIQVGFKDFAPKGVPAGRYLRPEIEGGPRRATASERRLQGAGQLPGGGFLVPGAGAQRDPYGNVSRGQRVKVLSALGALSGSGFTGNKTAGKKGRGKRRNEEYFAILPGRAQGRDGRGGGLKPGIYQRTRFAQGHAVKPVFVMTRGAPTYSRRLAFFGIAQKAMREAFPRELRAAFQRAMATARR